jgi:hypothetical protein
MHFILGVAAPRALCITTFFKLNTNKQKDFTRKIQASIPVQDINFFCQGIKGASFGITLQIKIENKNKNKSENKTC